MSYLDTGRKPIEMAAELLRQNNAHLLRVEFSASDAKQYHASVFVTIGGSLREWKLCDQAGALLQIAKPGQLVETVGRWGALAMVVIHDGPLLEVSSQQVFEQQQHYQRVVAARRQRSRFEKEKRLADAAYLDINQQIIMAAGWDSSSKQSELDYWAELQTRKTYVGEYRQWLAIEIDSRTSEIAAYEAAGNPESGYGDRVETFENIWVAGDPANINMGMLKAGWQISEISIEVGPAFAPGASVQISAGANVILAGGLLDLTRLVQYEIEPYESFSTDQSINISVTNAGQIGALKILVETTK